MQSRTNEIDLAVNDTFLDAGLLEETRRYLLVYGGAGSGKSVFAATKVVLRCIAEEKSRILVVRKVQRTIRNSTHKLLSEVIGSLGLSSRVVEDKTALGWKFIDTDSEIISVGVDDAEKLKSIHGVTSIWIEEATELSETDFDQIDLRLRGIRRNYKQILCTFNPVSKRHWIKARFFDKHHESARTHLSTYLDNHFIDDAYRDTIERLRLSNPNYYMVYGRGEWGELENGLHFKRDTLSTYRELPPDARGVIYGDPNLAKKSKGDTTAVVRLLFSASTQLYYIDDVLCRSFSDSNDLLDRFFDMHRPNARVFGLDGHVSQESTWTQHIANYARLRKMPVPVVEFKRYRTDDLAKNASLLWSEGRIVIREGIEATKDGAEFLAQLFSYAGKKAGKLDDAPDALICAVELIHERGMALRAAVAQELRKIL